ncbi:MAG: ATP-binding protein [Candidatus Sedimenticola sp. 6PFRAG5]
MSDQDSISTFTYTNRAQLTRQSPFKILQFFFAYRLLIASLLAMVYFSKIGPTILGQYNPSLFGTTSVIYLGFVIAGGLLLNLLPRMSMQNQAMIMVFTDIVLITILMHASGGIQSGLGMLLAVAIAVGSLTMQGVTALLVAAIASLAILTQQIYTQFYIDVSVTAYTQAGLLGASFFAIAILAHVLSQRLRESERLVSQRDFDLANLEQLNEYIIRNMLTGILVVDDEQKIRLINESAWHLLGMPDANPETPLNQTSPELAQQVGNWRTDPDFHPNNFRAVPNGRELKPGFSRLGTEEKFGAVIFLEDAATITQQAQQIKLASLGRLTASIAHEVRNPLGAISHAAQLLGESPEMADTDKRLLGIVETNCTRVNSIIENVLQLSRRSRSRPEDIKLKPWLEKFISEFQLTQELETGNIQLLIDPEQTIVRVDPSQLHQIVSNLCENAVIHYKEEKSTLRLNLTGGMTRESGGPFLDIIDNGTGIGSDDLKQIFEPFFTTVNSGTGLGLYIAKELCESNRLRLEYLTTPSGGACFRISFPSFRSDMPQPDE